MIYFTSDTHFFCRKGKPRVGNIQFPNTEDKNSYLAERWNERVREEDSVYILGDFSNGSAEETNEILRALKGKKYLIIGNNDAYLEEPDFKKEYFVWAKHYHEMHELGTKWVLFHFPLESWSGYGKDRIHLHGHLHRTRPVYEEIRRYEVGVDAHKGYPVSMEEIWESIKDFHNLSRRMPGVS